VLAEIAALELRQLSWRRVRAGVAKIAEQFAEHDLLTYSSAIAFQVLYAVVPLGLLALAALGMAGGQSVYVDHVAPTLRHNLSHDAYGIANRTALKVLNGERLWWTTVGLAVTIWGVGASLRSMMTPLNAVYGARETRSWSRRLVTSLAGGILVIVCVVSAIAVTLGSRLVDVGGIAAVGVSLLRWLVAVALLLGAIAALLWFVPAKKRPIEWISVGSCLAALCWIVGTLGFGLYIREISYSSFYGALATVVLLLAYLHVAAIAFLLGIVVDALLREEVRKQERRRRRAK
jgi:membrane protein